MTAAGTIIAMPTPVADGIHFTCRDSSTAMTMPINVPSTSAGTAPAGSALTPWARISANPAKRREMGEVKPACSPTMPYVLRSRGYIHDTAAAPTGVPSSCMIVRCFGDEPIMCPAL